MWQQLERDLAMYPSTVVTWVDGSGYPFSARCRPQPDPESGVLVLDLPAALPVCAGPAGLLCHSHDERLWSLRSLLVKGTLELKGDQWGFVPHRRTEGAGYGGLLGRLRFIRVGRRTAAAYLRARDLPRPRIDWAAMKELKRRAFQQAPPP